MTLLNIITWTTELGITCVNTKASRTSSRD